MFFEKILKSKSGEVFLGMMLGIVEIVAVAVLTISGISANNTVSQAKYASYIMHLGYFSDNVKIDAATVMAETGKKGKNVNNAQKFHMVANGFYDFSENDNRGVYDMQLPVGYVIPNVIKDALRIPTENNDIVAYLITDQVISGYENKDNLKFYTDEKNKEYHFVTSDGDIFTIPGYPEKQEDGSIKYYITSYGAGYVLNKSLKKPISADDFTELYGIDKDGEEITQSSIYVSKLKKKIDIKKDFIEKPIQNNQVGNDDWFESYEEELNKIYNYPFLAEETVSGDAEALDFFRKIGEYEDDVKIVGATAMADCGKLGININTAQKFYMVATGNEVPTEEIPKGEKLSYTFLDEDEECYEITNDTRINRYYYSEREKILPESYINEKHYVTSKGRVFVLPGYKVVRENGDVIYYVNHEDSYGKE